MRRVLVLPIVLAMLTACSSQSTPSSQAAASSQSTPSSQATASSQATSPSQAPASSQPVATAGASMVIAMFNPFTGADGAFGPEMAGGCIPAVDLINQSGGVLGHQLSCVAADTRGDPADAVPAAAQLLATTSNLAGVLGPSSDEADATAPIFNDSTMTMIGDTGSASFDQNIYPYFWRIIPGDDVKGTAMGIWGNKKGYTHAALAFGNDIGSQTDVPTLTKAFTKLGGTITDSESLALDQSSYRTEVAKIIASNPDVIFCEADPQTEATLLGELKELHGLIPIISVNATASTVQAVGGAIGKQALHDFYTAIEPQTSRTGNPWMTYNTALLASSGVPKPSQYSYDPFAQSDYDGVNIMALAMVAANSTTPSVYNSHISDVTNPGSGKTMVYSYAEGAQALAAGKTIQYVGASGPIAFNSFHGNAGGFELRQFQLDGSTTPIGSVSAADIAQIGQ